MAVCPRQDGHLALLLLPSWALVGSHKWRSPNQLTGQCRNLSMACSLWKQLSLIKSIPSLLFLRIPKGTEIHFLCLVDKNFKKPSVHKISLSLFCSCQQT